ncbi:hypothetical protein [Neobacillus citreus]|uniref:Uncharacterized protein n=1 Tax=Neobacillus citreus TaxID=2833578 RepID=A0A942T2Y1_9BACI|nr:hypothetical protein [Neobacillus citreus]MCH6266577.1 hypothetical protein [Neobacillus citreus]
MSFYENLPSGVLIQFYNEVRIKISKGVVSKNMYYELGLIIAAASKRGLQLEKPQNIVQDVNYS